MATKTKFLIKCPGCNMPIELDLQTKVTARQVRFPRSVISPRRVKRKIEMAEAPAIEDIERLQAQFA
jgi:hypothetical protein